MHLRLNFLLGKNPVGINKGVFKMKVYLAGYMSGSLLHECVEWRMQIRGRYENWINRATGNKEHYPIEFLDPFNGPELESLDAKGLKSSVPANAIFAGDMMSVKACDLVVANLDTFTMKLLNKSGINLIPKSLPEALETIGNLVEFIKNIRPMIGTFFELGWCTAWQKDFILIVPEDFKDVAEHHPFLKQASGVFGSVDEFLDSKTLNYFYKRINGANYEVDLEKLKG
jgi:ethanolamine utilization microcompartment shell protein EutS